jgi:uncharacterized protein DUF5343
LALVLARVAKSGATIPPYVPFSTFLKILRRMKAEGRAPDMIDRSYLSGMSGGYQSQVLAALKAYDFIEDDGRPTKDLERLLRNPDEEWPSVLRSQTAWLYSEPLELAERHATQGQLEKVFREQFDFTGSTLRKAIKFFLDASNYVQLELSPLWKTPSRASIPPTTQRSRKAKAPSARKALVSRGKMDENRSMSPGPDTHEIALESGGSVSLAVSVDLFKLSEKDRAFVFDLVDRVRSYQAESPTEAGEP